VASLAASTAFSAIILVVAYGALKPSPYGTSAALPPSTGFVARWVTLGVEV